MIGVGIAAVAFGVLALAFAWRRFAAWRRQRATTNGLTEVRYSGLLGADSRDDGMTEIEL